MDHLQQSMRQWLDKQKLLQFPSVGFTWTYQQPGTQRLEFKIVREKNSWGEYRVEYREEGRGGKWSGLNWNEAQMRRYYEPPK